MEETKIQIEELQAQVPESQVRALEIAAATLGRTWKSQLNAMWMSGDYGVLSDHDSALQNFRNASYGGPAGLQKYKANQTFEPATLPPLSHIQRSKINAEVRHVRRCETCKTVLTGTDLKFCPDCRPAKENCLADFECPACGQNERFTISFTGSAEVTDEGSDDAGDHEWEDDSACSCSECSHSGVVKNFDINDPSFLPARQEALDRLSGKLPPKGFSKPGEGEKRKFTVTVSRACPQYLRIPVIAKDREEAEELALEQAGNHDFKQGTSGAEADYRAEGVEEND